MTYVEQTDDDLLELSREGVASAFAVLLYRHGPDVLRMADVDPDPIGATVATFVRAMRTLPEAEPTDVRAWLLSLAAEEIDGEVAIPPPEPARVDGGDGTPAAVDAEAGATAVGTAPPHDRTSIDAAPLQTDDDLDEVWAELAVRWPTGKVARHLPSWAIWLLTTVILVALAVALPWVILGASADDEEAVEELRASPVHDDLTVQEEVIEEDEEPEPLPTFEFPQAPTEEAPEPEQAPEPETEAPAAPAPAPAPAPAEEPAQEAPPVVEEGTEAPADGDGNGDNQEGAEEQEEEANDDTPGEEASGDEGGLLEEIIGDGEEP